MVNGTKIKDPSKSFVDKNWQNEIPGNIRRLVLAVTFAAYMLLFVLLYNIYGKGLAALAILPVSAVGWFYGVRGGVIAGVLSLPFNLMLMNVFGAYALQAYIKQGGAIAGTLALMFIGGAVGRMAELSSRVKQELGERKAAEDDALATKEFLENVLASSLDCIAVTDENGYITRVNLAFLDMLGYTEEEVIGKGMYYFFLSGVGTYESTTGKKVTISDDFFVKSSDIIDSLLDGGKVSNWESYYLNKESQIIPVEQNVVILKDADGKRVGSVGIIRDITERKKVEEALHETSQTLLSLIKASPLAIVVFEPDYTTSIWNPAAEHILGWEEREVLGRGLPFVEKSGGAEYRRILSRVLAGETVTDQEMRLQRKDGTLIDVSFSSAPLCDEDGAVAAVMAIISDITEPKRLQHEILAVSGREQRRIGQDLHDGLGQVLTGVAFMGRALGQKLKAKGLSEAEAAAEITRLVNEAIAHTRSLARGLYPVTLESDGLMAALEELAVSTENLFNISCDFTYNKPLLLDDSSMAVHLYRIAQEAVNNAVRHGEAQHILISLDTNEDMHVVRVKDDGLGIEATSHQGKGMGINLMNYRAGIIGAVLDVSGPAGEGTTMTCSFHLDNHSAERGQ